MREVDVGIEVVRDAGKFFAGLDGVAGLLALLQDCLRRFRLVPEVRLADFFFECGYFFLIGGDVKDSSGPSPRASSARRTVFQGLRDAWP
jgi:hypothetical protein